MTQLRIKPSLTRFEGESSNHNTKEQNGFSCFFSKNPFDNTTLLDNLIIKLSEQHLQHEDIRNTMSQLQ